MLLFLTPPDCQKNTHSHEYGSISFGQFFEVSNQEHSMRSPLVLTELKQARVEMTQDLRQVFRLAKHHIWKSIVTLDEAWFYFSAHFDGIWLPRDDLSPSFPK
jgi:hypothetical protein